MITKRPETFRLIVRWLTLFTVFAATLAAAGAYHVIKKIPIPGNYGWDYVAAESEGRRLYVSHDTEIVVVDLDSDAIVGKITGGKDTRYNTTTREIFIERIKESTSRT
jgi:hypothetical protein